ncbi:hypothetical protein HHL11_16730 [Ramlibacter sp. G-1-2-2]|uniref:Uncharacterized protein n=1 Tax=Ramlibacter agri TaxID=2728837 RepID=A0A848H7D6_9BURK|nr:DUF5985 family protein [Ramlibacter agri]NML45401.1 hypothetical protein [Ramlibacter agri]
MREMMIGAIAVGWLLAGLFFFRFWRQTRDRFFLWFALSFWIEAADRIALGLRIGVSEDDALIYVFRLISYGLIILAIWQKNRPRT